MGDTKRRLDIKKVIDQGAQQKSLSDLERQGVRNVKVLDENAIQEMIRQAVDEVVSMASKEERAKIVAESRTYLNRLVKERNESMSKVDMAEAGKNELMQQIERLQEELKVRREVEQREGTDANAQVQELTEQLAAAQEDLSQSQTKLEDIQSENAYLREEHDKMVEQLDALMTENKELKAEIERLRALLEGQSKLEEERDAALQEVETLKTKLDRAVDAAQEQVGRLQEQLNERANAEAEEQAREEAEQRARQEAEQREREEAEQRAREEAEQREREEAEQRERDEAEQRTREEAEQREREEAEQRAGEEAEQREREEAEQRAGEEAEQREREEAEQRAREEAERLEQEEQRAAALAGKPTHVPVVIVPDPDAPPARPTDPSKIKPGKGMDIGTVNLVGAEQNEDGDVSIRSKRNAFIDIDISPYTKSMLTRLKVPYVIQNQKMYVLGEHAFELANVLNRNTRRPMKDGLISPQEADALPVMKLLMGAILGEARVPDEVCFYSVPGDPVDSELSVAYHRDLFDAVLRSLGYAPKHIIEGHAVTFAELAEDDFTGIGVSCGGGMFNICVAYKSMPALSFSTSRSGDWVDINVASAMGIKPAKASMIKEKGVDLMNPKNREEDAIAIYYRNLIHYNLTNIKERFEASENMPTFTDPVTMVFSGGTALAGGFIDLARSVFAELDFPIPVKELRLAEDPINSTAKGALAAAMLEMSHQAEQG